MVLAVNTKPLAEHYIPQLQRDLDRYAGGSRRRFQIHQAWVHATVLHDASTVKRLFEERRLRCAKPGALHWQADPNDDPDEMEVLQHLHDQAKTSPLLATAVSQAKCTDVATTSLFATCAVQSAAVITARALGRPLSSFHRHCIRWSILSIWGNDLSVCESAIPQVFPTAPKHLRSWWPYFELRLDGADRAVGNKPAVVWNLQFDFVDLQSPRSHPTLRSTGKRRRITLDYFHQASSSPAHDSSLTHPLPKAKKFQGVRHRGDRKCYVAEMKPPGSTNKVDFGQFKIEVEAAHAVDAAYHFYGKPDLLNFPDFTRKHLSTMPLPEGLGKEGVERFVKDRAKMLAHIASQLPSTPPALLSALPESSSSARVYTLDTAGFTSISEIASFLGCGYGDDGIAQPQPCLPPDPTSAWFCNGFTEPRPIEAGASGAITGTFENGQVTFQCSSMDRLADPFWCAQTSAGNSEHITDGWDEWGNSENSDILTNFASPSQPLDEIQRSWMEYLLMSPPAPVIPMPPSPSTFQDDCARGLLEPHSSHSFGGDRVLGMT